jgi:hypothetical protein
MIKRKIFHFRQEWLAKLPPAPEEGELVPCPACLGQHPLIYEDENPTSKSWGYVECDWEGEFLFTQCGPKKVELLGCVHDTRAVLGPKLVARGIQTGV